MCILPQFKNGSGLNIIAKIIFKNSEQNIGVKDLGFILDYAMVS